jgi:hypothetical protein
MNIRIKFDNLNEANEFADTLKDKNLRGVKVTQAQAKPEKGSLEMAEWMPLINLVIQSGLAATVVTSVFESLKSIFIENKKTKADANLEELRIESGERIEMAKIRSNTSVENKKIEQQSKFVEFIIENDGKKVNLKFTKGDEAEQAELLKVIREMAS